MTHHVTQVKGPVRLEEILKINGMLLNWGLPAATETAPHMIT